MDKNNQLIPKSHNNLILKATNTFSITNKLIIESNRKMIMEIFMKNPRLFINLISEYHPSTEEIIEKYNDNWIWHRLSRNESLPWSIKFIGNYADKWSWKHLSENIYILSLSTDKIKKRAKNLL